MRERRTPRSVSITVWAALLGLALTSTPLLAEEEASELPWRFDITAMNTSGSGPRSARLDLRLTRWSTEEERAALLQALKQGNSRSLPDALNRQESVGRLREIRGVGQDLRYSRRIPTEDGGQQIILATDRPLAFAEAWRASRSRDYNVTVILLDIGADGRGEGTMMLGAEVTFNEDIGQISVEHLTTQPIRLSQVRLR